MRNLNIKNSDKKLAYFPGCSLATSARENNLSLITFCKNIGFELEELEDWNCCGSSSAHSIAPELSFMLPARNFSLIPENRSLLVACPSCILHLEQTHDKLKKDEKARAAYEKTYQRKFDPDLHIMHFFELLDGIDFSKDDRGISHDLNGLKFVPYYGCMLARPPQMRYKQNHHGIMERVLSSMGAKPLMWAYTSRCCGTFLSVVRPDIVSPMVDRIVQGAMDVGADCIVTACAMCHMNLEVRCSLKRPVPILHFSELLSIISGSSESNKWFSRHLIDPRPLLKEKGLL